MELAEALLRLLGIIGRATGCLLILEDLHDADAESLSVIEYLVDNVRDLSVLLLATSRPQACPALDLARSAAQRRAAELLEPAALTPAEVRSLTAACLDTSPATVPGQVIDRLTHDADGNPFVVEELLAAMISSGALRRVQGSWQLAGVLDANIPNTVVRSVSDRVDRLGGQTRQLLHIAAVLGQRFPLPVLQAVSGLDDRSLLGHLRAATDAQLIVPDTALADWYTFRHALTADALLVEMMPTERSRIAQRTADTMEALHQVLPEGWPQLVAELRITSGQHPAAAVLLADAGRRTLAAGSSRSALALLDRAHQLDPTPEILASLIHALAEGGQLDRALELVNHLTPTAVRQDEANERASLHSRLAYAAIMARQFDDAVSQVESARRILGPDAGPEQMATLDVVEARLIFNLPGDRDERLATANRLARRAAEIAEREALPEVACQAWQLLSSLARSEGYEVADAWLERILSAAEEHNLPAWRIDALMRLGVNEFLRTGTVSRLHQGRRAAQQLGSIVLGLSTEVSLGLPYVMCGDFVAAADVLERCESPTFRMQNLGELQTVQVSQAMLAAHQGQRRNMDDALKRLRDSEGKLSPNKTLVLGMCRAVCALLEEDPGLAAQELDEALAWELANPTVYYLTGRYGLRLLVEVVAGRAGWGAHDEVVEAPTSTLRWNQQFVLFARAILHGRSGRPVEAAEAFEAAVEAAAVFPMAAHLGRRLVAEAAIVDGWGEPAVWLRAAEEYFHTAEVPAVASACRALLRRAGASAVQRRAGRDQIPAELRACGVTVREFEVFELLADHPGNQGIAKRLYISPRTVEKHVASLLAKTGHPDRAALSGFARQLLA
ncbi:DNA-binding CsgD family transcriptional regulator/tetratricopeptide (TPR) repeat protein [Longispora fulva]|uniref:DNA-binding CsgD family transcriptional regulator/tetratricopeptide (TPR) repeat protein n=1 Tax=Longispora fulva TaxID=619741 RepID=A0A8J7GU24_9ACTN|nr:DNA-binding CsgD family transcriptional regulator/tetratricopeptide (TPR) repeat protein [Longispora fulva]